MYRELYQGLDLPMDAVPVPVEPASKVATKSVSKVATKEEAMVLFVIKAFINSTGQEYKMGVSDIYNYIEKDAGTNYTDTLSDWKKNVRYILATHNFFTKTNERATAQRKGNYWLLDEHLCREFCVKKLQTFRLQEQNAIENANKQVSSQLVAITFDRA